MKRVTIPATTSSLELYLSEINRFPLLTVEEEQRLARLFRDEGDTRAAHRLVTANLRFVVKVAYEYRSYGIKMSDLIQEGNIGLMKAVQKFDPDKGIRLISYAVWWIRAYIQNYILKSLVAGEARDHAGAAQAVLLASPARAASWRSCPASTASTPTAGRGARSPSKLHVKPAEVREMEQRMGGRDLSLDAPMGEDGGNTPRRLRGRRVGGRRTTSSPTRRRQADHRRRVRTALARLDPRERFIIEQRVMSERPMTLKELGEHFGFSRERARQLEIRAKDKLKPELHALAAEIDYPTNGRPVDLDDAALA